jgi:hypothetical protein
MRGSTALARIEDMTGFQRYVTGPVKFQADVLEATGNVYLDGYWQSPKYFVGLDAILQKEFQVQQPLTAPAQRLAQLIADTDSISVNVRRTDYVTLPAARDTHGFVGKEYYDEGIELIAHKLRNPHIILSSDDLDWCRENLKFRYPTTFIEPECKGYKFGLEFALMTRCKHFLIPNSTFAWWTAWLSPQENKTIVCPRNWFRDPRLDSSDIVPSTWIRV